MGEETGGEVDGGGLEAERTWSRPEEREDLCLLTTLAVGSGGGEEGGVTTSETAGSVWGEACLLTTAGSWLWGGLGAEKRGRDGFLGGIGAVIKN